MKNKNLDSNAINAPESDYLYTQTSQLENSGNGLFTAIPIFKDEIIATFLGEILDLQTANERAKNGLDKYFIVLLNGSILDSMPVFCFAKFANDASGFSQTSFKNNAKITLDENNNVCLVATRKIKQNEEIFCSYGAKYWKRHK
jgi:uncharacterized protein